MTEVAGNTMIDGRYRILRRIGSGGMADVYCAEDTHLGRQVAIKVLHRRFAQDQEFVERFRREAKSAAGLNHPNVVGVFDRGEHEGTYYIAMEFLEGRTLKDIVTAEAPLEQERVVDLGVQILQAAGFAHRHGVIHRDFKPHNVIVDELGHAKVTDFGIARAGASEMTETGSIMGTAQYLSPEQAQGHAVTATSDIYSIGVMLYEMLAGRLPFDGDSAVAVALKHLSEPPAPISQWRPDVHPALEAVVMAALAKDPAQRWQSAEDFAGGLEAARAQIEAGPQRRAGHRGVRGDPDAGRRRHGAHDARRHRDGRSGGGGGRARGGARAALALVRDRRAGARAARRAALPDPLGRARRREARGAAGHRQAAGGGARPDGAGGLRGRDRARAELAAVRPGGRPGPERGRGGRRGLDRDARGLGRPRRGARPARREPPPGPGDQGARGRRARGDARPRVLRPGGGGLRHQDRAARGHRGHEGHARAAAREQRAGAGDRARRDRPVTRVRGVAAARRGPLRRGGGAGVGRDRRAT